MQEKLTEAEWRKYVGKLTIIGLDNGLSPGRHQAISWTNAGILLIGSLGTNFSEIVVEIQTFSFKKMYLKVSSGKWQTFCFGLNVLTGRFHPWGRMSTTCATKVSVVRDDRKCKYIWRFPAGFNATRGPFY